MSKRAREEALRRKPANRPPWLLFLSLGGLILMMLAGFAAWRDATLKAKIETTGAPRLRADREAVDLGNVQLGQTVKVAFELTNVGDQPLRFKEQPYIEVVEGC